MCSSYRGSLCVTTWLLTYVCPSARLNLYCHTFHRELKSKCEEHLAEVKRIAVESPPPLMVRVQPWVPLLLCLRFKQ